MIRYRRAARMLAFLAVLAPAPLRAQWSATLKGPETGITVTDVNPASSQSQAIPRDGSKTLTVKCDALDCAKLTAAVTHANVPSSPIDATAKTKTSASFTIPGNVLVVGATESAPDAFNLSLPGGQPDPLLSIKLVQPAGTTTAGAGEPAPDDGTSLSLAKLLATNCAGQFALKGGTGYSAEANQGLVMVSPTGNLLSPLPKQLDEDDDLEVVVVGDSRLLPLLTVRRTSAFREVGNITILGQEVDLQGVVGKRLQSRGGCGVDTVHVSNFAPGRGEVTISTSTGQTIGSFDLAVNHLYWGAFSMGVIRTPLLDPTFGLFFNGSDSVITATTDGVKGVDKNTHRILYTVLLTPFVWGRRDVEKPVPPIQHLNPTIGLVLNDVPNNFVAGVTADLLTSVFVTIGAHAGKVRELDPRSGLSVGDPFAGPASAIPTLRRWHTKFFVGASVDLRAAAQLLRTVLGSAAGQ